MQDRKVAFTCVRIMQRSTQGLHYTHDVQKNGASHANSRSNQRKHTRVSRIRCLRYRSMHVVGQNDTEGQSGLLLPFPMLVQFSNG